MQGAVKQLDLNYTYDKVGNVKSIGSETYRYDALDRLVSSKGPWGVITYGYDAVGNRLSMMQGPVLTSYTYNNVDELKKAGTISYSYDLNGNLKQEVAGSTTWNYRYDYQNQLISVTEVTGSSKTVVQKNVYDGAGNRVEQIAGSTTTVYLYQGTNVVYYKTGSSATKLFYADGMEIARVTGSSTYYYHGDELGSTRLESTSTGGTYFSSDYKPYGPQYQSSGTETFMYTDKPYDTKTGLYYFGARFYDPTTGRFITRDPGTGSLSSPMSLNQYVYAMDNPLMFTDPAGLDSKSLFATIGLVGIIIGLVAADVVQGGLDVGTDALTAAAIAELVGSAATVTTEEVASNVIDTLPTSADAIPLATQEEEEAFAVYEQTVYDQGIQARGAYGEEVFKGYLQNLGVDFDEQVRYVGKDGERATDFVIKQIGNLRNVAVEVKTAGMWGFGEDDPLQSIDKRQFGDYLFGRDTFQFGGILYANVPLAGRYGFSEGLQGALEFFGVGFKELYYP
jgi:RHS repeat-associated protein